MAKEALKKLKDQLECVICNDTYTEPKQLLCNHVFCRKCLVKLVKRDQQGMLSISCPICRQVTPVPARGPQDLREAFHITPLLELQVSFQMIVTNDAVDGNSSIRKIPSGNVVMHCFRHPEEDLTLYCNDCEDFICYKCAIQGGEHHSHNHELLRKAFEKYKEDIMASLEPMENQLEIITEALEKLGRRRMRVSDQKAAIKLDIKGRIARLHEILDAREEALTNHLNEITQAKLKELDSQQDQLETTQTQLSSCLDFMKESLKTDQ